MSTIRLQVMDSIIDAFCMATLQWNADEHTSLAHYVTQHGIAHLLRQGRLVDAEHRMLDITFMAAFSKAHTTVVEPLTAWRLVGLDKARQGFMACKAILTADTSTVDADFLDSVEELIEFLEAAGLYDVGILLAEWNLDKRIITAGTEHSDTISSTLSLASLYRLQGRYDEAVRLQHESLEIRERTSGVDHPSTLICVNNLAVAYNALGRFDDAHKLYLRALNGFERIFGVEHQST